MGVDLKVHAGIVKYKGHQCYNMRPRETKFSFGERNGEKMLLAGRE